MRFPRRRTKQNFFARWLGLGGEEEIDTTTFPKGKFLDEKFLASRKKNFFRNISSWNPDRDDGP